MSDKKKYTDDAYWMRSVRADLDSDPDIWAVQMTRAGTSKLGAIGHYLDIILTEAGYPPATHKCPTCGKEHHR